MIALETINPLTLPSLALADRKRLPNCVAVYFVLDGESVVYVGRSVSLVRRWHNHHLLTRLQSRGAEIRLAWLECSEPALLPGIEAALIEWFDPKFNRRVKPKGNPRPVQTEEFKAKRYHAVGEIPGNQPLAKKATGVKLPVDVDAAIRALPMKERVMWLRRVICNAAQAELLEPDQDGAA